MDRAINEPSIEEGAIRPLPKPRFQLDNERYSVELCKHCDGFGFVDSIDDFTGEHKDVVCWMCKGHGRRLLKITTVAQSF